MLADTDGLVGGYTLIEAYTKWQYRYLCSSRAISNANDLRCPRSCLSVGPSANSDNEAKQPGMDLDVFGV
jgi:hypothetical protein